MYELVNYVIRRVFLSPDKKYLAFLTNQNDERAWIAYEAQGECCSSSWFEAVNNIENLKDARVLEVHQLSSRAISKEEDHNMITVYGYGIKTEKGYVDIEFRNESNGYYGGSCYHIPNAKIFIEMHTGGQRFSLRVPDKGNPHKHHIYELKLLI